MTIQTATARLKLEPQKKPHGFHSIARGIELGYRRNQGPGTWVVRVGGPTGWTKRIGIADDQEAADGQHILDYWQAADHARNVARHGQPKAEGGPLTIAAAIKAYQIDLERTGGNVANATRILNRLPGWLADREVAAVTASELERFRDGLGMKPATLQRTLKPFKAALNNAAKRDRLIAANAQAWKVGLEVLNARAQSRKGADLTDAQVLARVAAAYAESQELGVFADVAAQTGARPSQLQRIEVSGLRDDRLVIPSSFKGKNGRMKPLEFRAILITPALAARLRQAAAGRALSDRLLLQGDYQGKWQRALADAGLPKTDFYAFRHSSIIRQLLAGIPTLAVAKQHFTGVADIENNYAARIGDHIDDLVRPTLAIFERPAPTNNVIALRS
jgi:integrase